MMLVNGEYQDYIPVTDRGLQYGDGLFETLCVKNGTPLFIDRHLARLRQGCQKLRIPFPSRDLLSSEIKALCQYSATQMNADDCVVKIIISRGSGGRGYRQPDVVEPTRIISLYAFPDYPLSYQQQGIIVRSCQTRLGLNSALAGLKHLNRLEQVMARAEWNDSSIQEGIMFDSHDNVIEGTMSNIFFVKQGVLYTPLLSQCGVLGIMRGIIIELAKQHHISVVEQTVKLYTLLLADEVFFTNAIIGIWPVKQIDTTLYGGHELTQQLQAWLEQFKMSKMV